MRKTEKNKRIAFLMILAILFTIIVPGAVAAYVYERTFTLTINNTANVSGNTKAYNAVGTQTHTVAKRGWHLVRLWGANGRQGDDRHEGAGSSGVGGTGGVISAYVWLEPGNIVTVNIGELGTQATYTASTWNTTDSYAPNATRAFGGGGIAGSNFTRTGLNTSPISAGGGGGGATDVRFGGTGLGNRIIIAGGGGGGGGKGSNKTNSYNGTAGGNGGIASAFARNGVNYVSGGLSGGGNTGGKGATGNTGGVASLLHQSGTVNPTDAVTGNGQLGLGGNPGGGTYDRWGNKVDGTNAGGGGGGYYGGGAGSGEGHFGTYNGGGGGGGSSFIQGTVNAKAVVAIKTNNLSTEQTLAPGTSGLPSKAANNGYAIITYVGEVMPYVSSTHTIK